MSRVGILTFSDGREFVHQGVAEFATDVEGRIAAACEAFGAEVVRGTEPITSATMAVREARSDPTSRFSTTRCGRGRTFPSTPRKPPLVLYCCSPTSTLPHPGMVGMLATAGSLDQLGRRHERRWGEAEEETVATRLKQLVCDAHAARSLDGCTFARVGGRSMGMYTAVERTYR
jgi:L-fucose isomerase